MRCYPLALILVGGGYGASWAYKPHNVAAESSQLKPLARISHAHLAHRRVIRRDDRDSEDHGFESGKSKAFRA